jgi:hypothetical protein
MIKLTQLLQKQARERFDDKFTLWHHQGSVEWQELRNPNSQTKVKEMVDFVDSEIRIAIEAVVEEIKNEWRMVCYHSINTGGIDDCLICNGYNIAIDKIISTLTQPEEGKK